MGGTGDRDPYRPPREFVSPGEPGIERDCTKVRFVTTLQQPPESPEHRPGDTFELLRVRTGDAIAIAAVDEDGQIIGTVVEELADLLRCTGEGVAFVAEVTSVSYGIHSVRVRASDLDATIGRRYQLSSRTGGFSGVVVLAPDSIQLEADIIIGDKAFVRAATCELRSLLRAGVRLFGDVGDDGDVVVRQP